MVRLHVLKIDGCRYHANFSIKKTNARVSQANLLVRQHISEKTCASYCIVHPKCYFFAHRSKNGNCVLYEWLTFPSTFYDSGYTFTTTNIKTRNVRANFNVFIHIVGINFMQRILLLTEGCDLKFW